MTSTIVAIATAHGISSLSIIRLSGSQSLQIAQKISKRDSITPRVATLSLLFNENNELIDQAIILYFQAPSSFTGEEIVEFQCHGGSIIAEEILRCTLVYGAQLAQPGEFSKRAFFNGKIDLTKAEATAKLIEAKSLDGAKILAKQLKGELKEFIDQSRDNLLQALAYSEVLIDYAEEDIPEDIIQNINTKLDGLIDQIENILESSHRRRGLIEGFKVAIIGKPNVGKSSLLNALLSYERAIVSDIAGTTRDTIEEQVRIGSHIIRLVDTAGIREAQDAIERIGIERSMSSFEDADIIIALFDGSREFDAEDAQILSLLHQNSQEKFVITAINKSDLEQKFQKSKLETLHPIEVSTARNFTKLTAQLKNQLDSLSLDEEIMLISARQIDAVEKTKEALLLAKRPLFEGALEFFSYHMLDAIEHLSSISKPFNSEEILDTMFSEFCLGK